MEGVVVVVYFVGDSVGGCGDGDDGVVIRMTLEQHSLVSIVLQL